MTMKIISVLAVMQILAAPCRSTPLKVAWRWSQSGCELYSPAFSPDGREVAVVSKPHEPDGAEAEVLGDKVLANFQARAQKDPRWADPQALVLQDGGKSVEKVGDGWSPTFSPDGRKVVFSAQKDAISGLRVLAQTLAGNEIAAYDRVTKTTETWVKPTYGHLDAPAFSLDGTRLAYGIEDATNGDWAGQVGVGILDLKMKTAREVLPEEKIRGALTLVPAHAWRGGELLALRARPASAPDSGETSYAVELAAVSEGTSTVHSWGVQSLEQGGIDADFSVLPDGGVLVFDKRWLRVDPKTGAAAPLPAAANFARKGMVSPSGANLARASERTVSVDSAGSNKAKFTWTARGDVAALAWSPDSRRLAVVVTHKKDEDIFLYDELVVLTVP
jgi:hypothetical protein